MKKRTNMSQPQTRENAGDYITIDLCLHLIGSGDGASFPDQSKSEVKQIKARPDHFRWQK